MIRTMGEFYTKIQNQFAEFAKKLDKKQKIMILSGSILFVLSVTLAIFFLSKPKYVPIYSNLSLEEAGQITSKLDEYGIKWQDDKGGTTILVPERDVNKARMNLAIEGYPYKGITWEDAFNQNSLTTTNEERRMMYLRAEINSLARTIEEIQGVEKARVHLTVPDESKFWLKDENSAKASIFLSLKPGIKLSNQQINGIVMLVVNAVDGLTPENVTVHDDSGAVLNQGTQESDNLMLNDMFAMEENMRKNLETSIIKFLSKIYGEGNVDVIINLDLDFDNEITNIVEFSPPIEGEEQGLIRSIIELQEQVINNGNGGIPGTDSNIGITEYQEIDESETTYTKTDRSVNYELNEIRKTITKAPGKVKNITIAVVINSKALVNEELTEDHKQELKNLISAAAGLETRVVEVMAREFTSDSENQLAIYSDEESNPNRNLIMLLLGIIAVLIIGTSIFIIRRRQSKEVIPDILTKDFMKETSEIDEIELDLEEKTNYKKQIEKFIDKKPESVAQLLRTWLNED